MKFKKHVTLTVTFSGFVEVEEDDPCDDLYLGLDLTEVDVEIHSFKRGVVGKVISYGTEHSTVDGAMPLEGTDEAMA